jgi:pimeloyl-ACP methyl ester carboxylesterase
MFATSGRARFAYESASVEDGADVLLIHAGVNDRRSWQHVIERLSPRHRRVAFDQRGFSETTREREDGWSPVIDALAVLDATGLKQAVVVTRSIGGQTAIDLSPWPTLIGWQGSRSSGVPFVARPTRASSRGRRRS